MADPGYITGDTAILADGEAWVALGPPYKPGDVAFANPLDAVASSVNFTSPADGSSLDWSQFVDLVAIIYWRSGYTTGSGYEIGECYFNEDYTASNYYSSGMFGNGSGSATAYQGSPRGSSISYGTTKSADTDVFNCCISHFFDINSGKYKSSIHESANAWDWDKDADPEGWVSVSANTWKNQAPITAIRFRMENGTLPVGCRFDLFGVLPRMTPPATATTVT